MQAHELPSLADAPGTLREYETIYIMRPGTTNDGVAEVNLRVRGIIESMGGKVIKVDNWGKRRLAYEVAKERKGIYLYWQYLASRGVISEIERNLRMIDEVIRYMTIKLDVDIVPDQRDTEVTDETYERAANTAADEEDMYLTRPEGEEGEDGEDGKDGKKRASRRRGDDDAKSGDSDSGDSDSSDSDSSDSDSKDAKSEDAKAEDAKAEDAKAEDAKAEDTKADDANSQED